MTVAEGESLLPLLSPTILVKQFQSDIYDFFYILHREFITWIAEILKDGQI